MSQIARHDMVVYPFPHCTYVTTYEFYQLAIQSIESIKDSIVYDSISFAHDIM